MTIRVCAWHDAKQQTLWAATHGVCPLCRESLLIEIMPTGDRSAKWPQLMKDGGWEWCVVGDWQRGLARVTDGILEHVEYNSERRQWVFTRAGEEVSAGSLDEVLAGI